MVVKKANNEYIVNEEIEFLGAPVGDNFVEPEKNLCGHENIKVELLGSPNYNEWIECVFYNCFSTWNTTPHKPVTKMMKELSFEEKEKKVLYMLTKRPISAVLEYGMFAFRMSGVPRSFTHQIVRHRQMAFSQQSFRVSSCYSDPIMAPQELFEMEDEKLKNELLDECGKLVLEGRRIYKKLIESGISMEASRNFMFMGTCTELGAVMRLRDLIDYFRSRTSDITQDTHTYIVCLTAEELKKKQPKFFDFVLKNCKGLEETMKKYLSE